MEGTELRRQLIHVIAGSAVIWFVLFLGRTNALLLASLIFLIGLIISILLKWGYKIPIASDLVKVAGREKEKSFPAIGALMFFSGIILTMAFFQDLNVIIGALVVAVYGDGASTLIGKAIGKIKTIGGLTLEGTIGGMIVSFLLLAGIFDLVPALWAAIFGMASEMLPIDDNVSIPIVAAIVLTILL
ncbi:MAG: hypothetical protein ABID38_02435 [Candidatus Diapherotrites archaeon]